jgi:hypothetical protein
MMNTEANNHDYDLSHAPLHLTPSELPLLFSSKMRLNAARSHA